MKWLIKNPAPVGKKGHLWGDFHFGLALKAALERLGQEVLIAYFDDWDKAFEADVELLLRGKFQAPPSPDRLSLLWVISHPDTVSITECQQYNCIFAASERHTAWLGTQLEQPVKTLLQCVDTTRFRPPNGSTATRRQSFVFIGNSRNARRDLVIQAIQAGLPVQIWGRGWDDYLDPRFVVAEYLDNQAVAELYRNSRLTLNDHWPDMRRWGYVNNRIFDALACGLPVLSDWMPEIEGLFPNSVICCSEQNPLSACLERILLGYPGLLAAAAEDAVVVKKQHSFDHRAKTLLDTATGLLEKR